MTVAVRPKSASLKLKYAVELRRGRVEGADSDAPYVGLENIESGTGRLVVAGGSHSADTDIPSAGGDSLSTAFWRGDILFGKLRPYLAKAWVADFDGRCTTELLPLRPEKIDARFGLYAILSQEFIRAVDASTFGSKMPRADWEFIGNVLIPFPEKTRQAKISAFLDRELGDIDDLIAAKQRLLDHLAEKRRAVVADAVMRGLNPSAPLRSSGVNWLGDIPAHWEVCHLKRTLTNLDYGTSEATDVAGSVAVLRMGDIRDGELDFSNLAFLDQVDDGLLLEEGDLVFNRTNSLDQIGKVALFRGGVDFPVSFASYLVRLRCKQTVLPEYLNWVLNSSYALAWGRAEALPSIGQANLNPSRYGYLPIARPPLAEQQTIANYLAGSVEQLDSIRVATEHSIKLLNERRGALIAAAVTGQVNIPESS